MLTIALHQSASCDMHLSSLKSQSIHLSLSIVTTIAATRGLDVGRLLHVHAVNVITCTFCANMQRAQCRAATSRTQRTASRAAETAAVATRKSLRTFAKIINSATADAARNAALRAAPHACKNHLVLHNFTMVIIY